MCAHAASRWWRRWPVALVLGGAAACGDGDEPRPQGSSRPDASIDRASVDGGGGKEASPPDSGVDASASDSAVDASSEGSAADVSLDVPIESSTNPCRGTPPPPLGLEEVHRGFRSPVFVTSEPGDPTRLYVVELEGRIMLYELGAAQPKVFLDWSAQVTPKAGNSELGMLSMAFHPDYGQSGERRFWVFYNALDDAKIVASFERSVTDPDAADPASESVLFTLPQPAVNHNGGMIAFAPDGTLYVGLGDGNGPDAKESAQDPGTQYGAMLRFDVDGHPVPPPGNLVGDDVDPYVIHYGLRNPWRFSFDRLTGDLYIGDVGGDGPEEIDLAPAGSVGLNFGWAVTEGEECRYWPGPPPDADCDRTGITPPIEVFHHTSGSHAVAGGYVYRGSAIPELFGRYLYADIFGNQIWTLVWDGTTVCDRYEITADLVPDSGFRAMPSFGEDADGELYLIAVHDLFRLVAR